MKIILNGAQFELTEPTISYDEICALAGHNPDHGPTVTYLGPDVGLEGKRSQGSLWRGRKVDVAEGTRFNVVGTYGA